MRRNLNVLGWGMVLCAFAAAQETKPTPDPIEGKWSGMAGLPQDRVHIGFEFKRDEKQEIKVLVYNPVVNFFGLEVGTVSRNGNEYSAAAGPMHFILRNGKVDGTTEMGMPVQLERTSELPREMPVPELPSGPGPKWRTKLGGAIYAPVEVRGGVAYVGTTGGMFYAVRLSDGNFIWNFPAGHPIYGQALATSDDLFFVCDNGFLYRLDRASGKEIWRYDLGDAQASRVLPHQVDFNAPNSGDFDWDSTSPKPLLVDDVLYVGSGDGSFHAVKADRGTRVWRFEAKGKIRTDAVSTGTRIIFGSFDRTVYAVDRETGSQIWSRSTGSPFTGSPAIIAGKVVIGNRGGALFALDPATGQPAWRMLFWGSSVESTAVPGDAGLFYIGSSDMRRISMIDSQDGRVAWRTDVFGWAWSRPAVTTTTVYAAAVGSSPYSVRQLGSISALDRQSGKILWRWPMPEWPGSLLNGFVSAPAIEGKTLIAGGLDGTLYAFPIE
jgi:outer membrane protein assembly factor BamB